MIVNNDESEFSYVLSLARFLHSLIFNCLRHSENGMPTELTNFGSAQQELRFQWVIPTLNLLLDFGLVRSQIHPVRIKLTDKGLRI